MIPPQIGNISELRVLSIGSFHRIGFILRMQWLSRLRWLRHLDISFIDLSKATDWFEVINTLPSLDELHLSGCRLSDIHPHVPKLHGPIPNSIGRLSSLKRLYLSYNRLNGSIPNSIEHLSSLEVLRLPFNQLSGNLPVSLSLLSRLIVLDISFNLLTGVVTEAHFVRLVNLKYLVGNENNLTLKLQIADWVPPFQILFLYLNSWALGPDFPLWLQSQRDLINLDISNACISSPMPPESFWRSFPNLTYLDMLNNHIKDTLTLFFPSTLDALDLSSNQFTGTLPSLSNGSLIPIFLDLSNNSFMGSLHQFLCFNGVNETLFLSLGYNHLSGVVPECWNNWSSLVVLILENNNLSGEISRTIGSLLNLKWLNMHGNKISGRLPSSLMNLSSLRILQLGRNELIGNIPPWIGTKLTLLGILNLRSNNLDGNIPEKLCYLSYIQIIDLAENNLSGNIPRCFNNFSMLSGIVDSIDEFYISLKMTAPTIIASDTLVMKGQ
ncbi:hypothetical protein E3N88_12895 [Mikania micrantha]|uniref:Leucine-rich repeat-containing N-terminal plant-type domain-containing protein n=1 Tax=Mikania micrantha TaxID=192012 RepID=A0A5N6P9S0_9ASTR|nr:hypothetical protein E3N88_12895 [Mikania micrantha]